MGAVKPVDNSIWIYIYTIRGDQIFFDRSVSSSGLGPNRALQIIDSFKKKGVNAFYTCGCVIDGALS